MLEFNVTEAEAGRKLYGVLKRELMLSSSMIRRLKWTKGLFVNGELSYTTRILKTGDKVSVDVMSAEAESALIPEDGPLDIIFENDGLVAVNKPAGIICHPSRAKYTGTLANFVSGYLFKTCGSGACHAVNRLDRDTSGAVLFAKNAHYKTLASSALRSAGAIKQYTALVYGRPKNDSGVFDMPIKRVSPEGMLRAVLPDGQRAVTYYEVAGNGFIHGETVSLLKLRLGTGRTHQIRVHCLAAGIPVLGDPQYNTASSARFSAEMGLSLQTLHAEKLSFFWPPEGKVIDISADIRRDDMRNIMDLLLT